MKACGFYVEVMRGELARRKALNPRYSLRSFARNLGIDPAALCRILHGKQPLSARDSRKVLLVLRLGARDARLFLESVLEDHAERMRRALLSDAAVEKLLLSEVADTPADAGVVLALAERAHAVLRPALGTLAQWISVHLPGDRIPQRLTVLHEREIPLRKLASLEARFPPDPEARHGFARVLRTGQPEILEEIPMAMLEDDYRNVRFDEAALRFYLDFRLCSQISLPLRQGSRVLGALTLSWDQSKPSTFGEAGLRRGFRYVEELERALA
jgi:hypothetical protein